MFEWDLRDGFATNAAVHAGPDTLLTATCLLLFYFCMHCFLHTLVPPSPFLDDPLRSFLAVWEPAVGAPACARVFAACMSQHPSP